jgi:hypothetical protein
MALRHAEVAFDLTRNCQGTDFAGNVLAEHATSGALRGYSHINEKNRPVEDWARLFANEQTDQSPGEHLASIDRWALERILFVPPNSGEDSRMYFFGFYR